MRKNGKNTDMVIKRVFGTVSIVLVVILIWMVGKYVIQDTEYREIRKEFISDETVAPALDDVILYDDTAGETENEAAATGENVTPITEEEAFQIYAKQGLKQIDHAGLKKLNADYLGWLDIPGTSISYPFVQSHDNQEYLKRSFEGRKRASGSIFVDANIRDIESTKNLLIHGHNMKSGSMFASLPSYGKLSFYNKHPFVYLYTPDEVRVYQVMAAYTLKHDANEETAYQSDFSSEDDYEAFVNGLLNRSVIHTNINNAYDSQILTLSTCVNHSSSRFIVHAIRFR